MKKIFVVDDDAHITKIIRDYLVREGFSVCVFPGADSLLAELERGMPDMFILDIMMPGMDGLELCREIRRRGNVPVIFVSARGEEMDRVLGLELGGDDYLTKPFSPRELVARVRTVLRRTGTGKRPAVEDEVRVGDLVIYPGRREAAAGTERLELTVKEFDLLHLLAANPGQAFSREQILNRVWGYDYVGDNRAVDDVVKRLRRKMKDSGTRVRVNTVWGYGYKIND
ncbi:response regulator transcription factor [Desulfallas thermosapovorans]|uniref:Stage 0 sporulation protein A homolog n=1 Tax=Desulfallas thermosapovorans DSM 6562 TaxID=1121431 RepID=A0A5S4ZQ39_9FIRM|nr:response regulator transcription factor [Desulfallas thermosapovorans]TYO94710.1 DNA-binding response OmpR family regulator [Desulfallas thermosapovorans DSM 6562]